MRTCIGHQKCNVLFQACSQVSLPQSQTHPTTIYSTIDRMRTSQSTPVSASGLTETTATATTITPRMQFSKTRRRTQVRGINQDQSGGRKFTNSIMVSGLAHKGLVVYFVDFWTIYEHEDVRWTIETALGGKNHSLGAFYK